MKRATIITWEQVRVGTVILIAIGILGLAIVKLGQAASLFTPRYELTTFFGSAPGLRVGGSVSLAGQIVGVVKEVEFLPPDADTSRSLRVVVAIDARLKEQVRENSRAQVKNIGLLGDKIVDISPGTLPFGVLQAGDTLVSIPSVDYDQVIAKAAGAVGDVVDLTADMRAITSGLIRGQGTMGQLINSRTLYDQLLSTLARTNETLARVQSPNGTFGRLLDDPTLYNRTLATLSSLDSLVGRVGSKQGTVGQLLADSTLYRNMVSVTAEMQRVVESLSRGNGAAAKLLRDPALYDHFEKTLADLSALIADMRANPKKYFKGVITIF